MALSKDDFLHLCKLAKLAPAAEKQDYYSEQCGNILAYMDKLSELDCSGVDPLYSPVELNAALCSGAALHSGRQDEACRRLTREEILANAPARGGDNGEFFLVPRIVEGR
ncbi:MAG TPA: Asp-tRNA(Asn)/Glu-tRNA(Gln) amidotransferase subunit GatC [Candidatus Mailhella merdavium]|nr:Asp-tRNA(Asn)/Glu-tRNA(Gln) amidotransferase subunit GatC [Candidatus Mailhella merdavium]